jgi:hypothetical protein
MLKHWQFIMMGKHASIACLLLSEDHVWVSLGNAMNAKQSEANGQT